MGFVEIEVAGKKALEQFPVIKRSAKRAYQLVSVATNKDKVKAEGDITRVSPDDGYEYFYGYYDKSPWDATDRYMICVRVQQAYKSVAPKEPGTVCLIDTKENNKIIEIGTTHAWNVQQSCMAQWMGPDFKSRIIYNDFRNGHYCSVIFNVKDMREEKELSLPVYDVSRDGTFALSLDFNRLHRMRPGYGYSNQPDKSKGILCPDKTCIWKVDIVTGEVEKLFKYTDFAAFEPDETMNGAEHKVNHLMISPNGKRFMVLHRWFDKGRKHTRLVTVNVDKTEMYNLSDDVFVSHCYWKNDNEILSFLRKKETGDHYYLMKDKTQEYQMYWPELNTDGHCSYSPEGKYIITDTYPNRKRIASVFLCIEDDNRSRRIARVFSPFKYDNDCRCDLHPRWNREGNKICIDSVHEGKRGLYVIPVKTEQEESIGRRIKLMMVFSSVFDGMGICHNVFNYCKYIDRSKFEIEFAMINEPTPYFKKILDESGDRYYVLPMRNKNQIAYINELKKVLKNDHIDIIHAHGNSGTLALEMIAGLMAGTPVRIAHSRNSGCQHQKADKILRPIFLKTYTDAFAVSKEAGDWLFKGRPYTVIKNGNDIDKFKFNKEKRILWRKNLGLDEDVIAIGHVGTFNERKNQKFAVEILKELKHSSRKYKLFFIGDGSMRQEIERMVDEYDVRENTVFLGVLDNMEDILQAMDIMLLTSFFEGLPNTLIEWQAAGLPSLVSDTVTKEAKVTNLPIYLSLKKGAKRWAEVVVDILPKNRAIQNDVIQDQIRECGFDVKRNAGILQLKYIELMRKES